MLQDHPQAAQQKGTVPVKGTGTEKGREAFSWLWQACPHSLPLWECGVDCLWMSPGGMAGAERSGGPQQRHG